MQDDTTSGVSPVVGAILMVAVTVILSATVGMFVFQMQPSGPGDTQSGIRMQETDDGVVVTAVSTSSTLAVQYNGVTVELFNSTGESVTIPAAPGERITVVAQTDGQTDIVASHTVSESPGLLAYYPLDGSPEDKSGNEFDAGTVRINVTTGIFNKGYNFTGGKNTTQSELHIPAEVYDGQFQSVCFYAKFRLIKSTMPNADGTVWDDHNIMHDNGHNDLDDEYGWHVYNDTYVSVGYGNEGRSEYLQYGGIHEDGWVHLCQTITEDTMRLYVNGTQVDSMATPPEVLNYGEVGAAPLFGRHARSHDNSDGLYGRLDEVRYYRTSLTGDQVQMLYNMTEGQ